MKKENIIKKYLRSLVNNSNIIDRQSRVKAMKWFKFLLQSLKKEKESKTLFKENQIFITSTLTEEDLPDTNRVSEIYFIYLSLSDEYHALYENLTKIKNL